MLYCDGRPMVDGAWKRTTAVALALLMAVLMTFTPPASAASLAEPLARWEALTNGLQDPVELRLQEDQYFEDYYFQLKPGDDVAAAVAFVEVTNRFGDFVCRGIVTHQMGLLSIHRHCPNLETDRTYVVTWITDRSGNELLLTGFGSN
jgi:hypothetical protein